MTTLPNVFPAPSEQIYGMVERRVMRRLRDYAEFEADWSRWYRDGDGRPTSEGGKGYRYPYSCIHGASAYTDYDNICGPCEGGYAHWDYARELADAYRDAVWAFSQRDERYSSVSNVVGNGRVPFDIRVALAEWALAPVSEF